MSDAEIDKLLPEVRRLRDENKWGSRKIGDALGIGKDAALRLLRKLEREDELIAAQSKAVAIIAPNAGPAISFYDAARHALTQAKTLSEVKDISDKAAAMAEYGRRAKDDSLKWDAEDIQVRAAAEWGRLAIELGANKGTRGQLRGDVPVGGSAPEPPTDPVPTLKEMGVDKRFSATAKKLAKLSDRAIDARLSARRKAVASAGRGTMDILKPGPSRSMNRVEAADSLDPFFTPPWATRSLIERVFPQLGMHPSGHTERTIWEPACGEGHMSGVLQEYSECVFATDIHDYTGNVVKDFLTCNAEPGRFAWIITNPPFKKDDSGASMAESFVLRALDLAYEGVAMFVALQFLEGVGRYERIFKDRPPTLISFFAERVNCIKGRWDPDGSTDAAYVWLVWHKDRSRLPDYWIPPGQRKALTKPDDRERYAAWSLKAEAAE